MYAKIKEEAKLFILEVKACIDNYHLKVYSMASMMMLLCSCLTSATNWFGNPIECFAEDPVEEDVFTSYCYMETTVTYSNNDNDSDYSFVTKPSYYQWVSLLLFMQAILTQLPCMAWSHLEGGKITKLIKHDDLNIQSPVLIGKFLNKYRGWYSKQALSFLMCQILCLVVSVAQVLIINQFLEVDVVTALFNWPPPIFPRVVKCDMPFMGVGGSVQEYSGICSLGYNALHEKIYMVVIPSCILLVMFSITYSILYLLLFLLPCLRLQLLHLKAGNLLTSDQLGRQVEYCSYQDFILLMLISKNMGPQKFYKLLKVWAGRDDESVESTETEEEKYCEDDKFW